MDLYLFSEEHDRDGERHARGGHADIRDGQVPKQQVDRSPQGAVPEKSQANREVSKNSRQSGNSKDEANNQCQPTHVSGSRLELRGFSGSESPWSSEWNEAVGWDCTSQGTRWTNKATMVRMSGLGV